MAEDCCRRRPLAPILCQVCQALSPRQAAHWQNEATAASNSVYGRSAEFSRLRWGALKFWSESIMLLWSLYSSQRNTVSCMWHQGQPLRTSETLLCARLLVSHCSHNKNGSELALQRGWQLLEHEQQTGAVCRQAIKTPRWFVDPWLLTVGWTTDAWNYWHFYQALPLPGMGTWTIVTWHGEMLAERAYGHSGNVLAVYTSTSARGRSRAK